MKMGGEMNKVSPCFTAVLFPKPILSFQLLSSHTRFFPLLSLFLSLYLTSSFSCFFFFFLFIFSIIHNTHKIKDPPNPSPTNTSRVSLSTPKQTQITVERTFFIRPMESQSLFSFFFCVSLTLTVVYRVAANSEGDALYTLKRSLADPDNVLQSWDPTLVSPCTWFHVTCNQDNRVTRVYSLSLSLSVCLWVIVLLW